MPPYGADDRMILDFVGERVEARGIYIAVRPNIEHCRVYTGDGHIVPQQERICNLGLQDFKSLTHSSDGCRPYSLVSVFIIGVAELIASPCHGLAQVDVGEDHPTKGIFRAPTSLVLAPFCIREVAGQMCKIATVSVIVVPSGSTRVGIWPHGLISRKLSGRDLLSFELPSVNSKSAPARTRADSTAKPPEPGRL
jgi:hypothetical protein